MLTEPFTRAIPTHHVTAVHPDHLGYVGDQFVEAYVALLPTCGRVGGEVLEPADTVARQASRRPVIDNIVERHVGAIGAVGLIGINGSIICHHITTTVKIDPSAVYGDCSATVIVSQAYGAGITPYYDAATDYNRAAAAVRPENVLIGRNASAVYSDLALSHPASAYHHVSNIASDPHVAKTKTSGTR